MEKAQRLDVLFSRIYGFITAATRLGDVPASATREEVEIFASLELREPVQDARKLTLRLGGKPQKETQWLVFAHGAEELNLP